MDDRNRRSNDYLGVNKIGKNIRKLPLHHPNNNFANATRQRSLPQVYNINKNDFRNLVQQLTGSPARETMPRPVNYSPKPQSQRLQKIRPPPLTPINRPPIWIHHPGPGQGPVCPAKGPPVRYGNNNVFVRPPPQFSQPSPMLMTPQNPPPGGNVAESLVSLYMQGLHNLIIDTVPGQPQGPPQPQPQFISSAPGLLPNPPAQPLISPRMGVPQPLLPSPDSRFLLPSPSGFLNMMSPRSLYPLPSPGYQFPPPLSPSFGFPPMSPTGILGPAGFFPVSSPGWRDQKL